jgi:hypothetical protein
VGSVIASIAFQIGLSTGHFKNYEWAMMPMFTLSGLLFSFAALVWFRTFWAHRKALPVQQEHPAVPPIHVENKPETKIENKPVFNNQPIFENKPTFIISPAAAPAAAPAPAPAPAPLPDARPKLSFDRWDFTSTTMEDARYGFFINNDGETALDVHVRPFQISAGKSASSDPVTRIPAHAEGFIQVWLDEYASVPHSSEKSDLLAAMRAAFKASGETKVLSVPVIVRYEDFDENIYESAADLRYVASRDELEFGPTKQRKVDAREHKRLVLDFLKRDIGRHYFVEEIAAFLGLTEQETWNAAQQLVVDGQAFRSSVNENKWGYIYWYAHF